MLNWNVILTRIRDELALPNHVMEKSNDQIVEYLKESAVRKIADYIPDVTRLTIDTMNSDIIVPGKENEYFIIDPDDREIFDVLEMYTDYSTDILFGKRFIAAWSMEEVPGFELSNMRSGTTKLFSDFYYMYEFKHPNIIQIRPKYKGKTTLEYERSHDPELSTIPKVYENLFIELCLGMFMMNIGRLRTRYSNIQTAFGEIQLNGEDIKNEGKDFYQAAIDKLDRTVLTSVVMDRG
jgi:hypothetical protein